MPENTPALADWRSRYARSTPFAIAEVLVAVVLLSLQFLDLGLQVSPVIMLLGWLSLILRRVGWKGVGMGKPEMGWARTLIWGVLGAVIVDSLSTWVVGPAVQHFTGQPTDLSSFRPLVGNLGRTLVLVTVGWTFAAFGEEIVFRSYLSNRVVDIVGNSRAGWYLALAFSSVFFGLLHNYQGITGVIDVSVSGALFGLGYYLSGRNLWVAILMHGFADTIGVMKLYFGIFPGA
jgi:hypothetical protein